MKASFITYADFGKRKNLKSEDIIPAVSFFSQQNAVAQVISRLGSDSSLPHRSAVPYPIHFFLGVARRVFGIRTRYLEERVFDFFAKRLLWTGGGVAFFHPPNFPRTIQSAKQKGMCCVGIATNSHPEYVSALIRKELQDRSIKETIGVVQQEKTYSDKMDYLVTLSPFSMSTYVQSGYPAERIFVARLDIDTKRFVPKKQQARRKVFTVLFPASSFGVLKGLQYLVDAWQKFDVPNKKLIILGEFTQWPVDMRSHYEKLIADDGTIEFRGIVSSVETVFQESDVVTLPSFSEGFSRSVAEAMATALPVITTNNATDTENFFKDGLHGIIVPPGDSSAIAKALYTLHNDEQLRTTMGNAARNAVLEKTPFGEELFSIYQSIQEGKVKA